MSSGDFNIKSGLYTPLHSRYHFFTRLFNHRVVPDDDSLQKIITIYEESQGTQSGPAFATVDVNFSVAQKAVQKESIEIEKQAQQSLLSRGSAPPI